MEKRAQRIPSWPGVIHSNKGRIHLRRPTCGVLKFRLRRGGGPYIPITRLTGVEPRDPSSPVERTFISLFSHRALVVWMPLFSPRFAEGRHTAGRIVF